MELLLNLAWLILVLPACWLGRRSKGTPARHRFTSGQCLLALGCILVILFPVVSATDDLHAIRAEMEESPVSKRDIQQASHDKTLAGKLHSPAVLFSSAAALFANGTSFWQQFQCQSLFTPVAPADVRSDRSPPGSSQG